MLKKIGYILIFNTFLYLSIPSPQMPADLPNAPKSQEPGDLRNPSNFAAYFTNLSREEVMAFYDAQFRYPFLPIIPNYQLIYPPEEAFTYIADQTRSTHLRELVHPFRESIFINFYEPKPEDDQIAYQGQPFRAKITVRYYQSYFWARLFIVGFTIMAIWYVIKAYYLQWRVWWKIK